ncbi:hypothetical protein, partial [Escherichia coli]|uniref:hypothetical protein n=1 Tax=Escherichia coli TaxID=562 RepID=UPI0015C4187E
RRLVADFGRGYASQMASADITDGRLGVLDAARRLRITPELLFSYVKHGAKGRDGRRLLMVADAPGNLFAESELEAFDAYLREP